MRLFGLLLISVALSGCCSSPYAHDPRAAVVGPAYLDYIADYPRDCATQYYYPSFHLSGDVSAPPQPVAQAAAVPTDRLLIPLPAESSRVQNETGEGYPKLEAKGIRVFTGAEQQ